jgi:hypothetical protein
MWEEPSKAMKWAGVALVTLAFSGIVAFIYLVITRYME